MPKFVLWNTNRNEDFRPSVSLALQENADFVVLLETRFDVGNLRTALNLQKQAGPTYYCSNSTHGKNDIYLVTRWPVLCLEPLDCAGDGAGRMKAWRIRLPVENADFLLFAIHGPDRMHYRTDGLRFVQAAKMKNVINSLTAKFPDAIGTIVVGDFNMNPFELGMVAEDGFDSFACQRQLSRRRKEGGYYNPTWSLFGDRSKGPPGTYFFGKSKDGEFSWHVLDQVLLSRSMVGRLVSLEVPKRAGTQPLRRRSSRIPTVSDHFPLVFELEGS